MHIGMEKKYTVIGTKIYIQGLNNRLFRALLLTWLAILTISD